MHSIMNLAYPGKLCKVNFRFPFLFFYHFVTEDLPKKLTIPVIHILRQRLQKNTNPIVPDKQ